MEKPYKILSLTLGIIFLLCGNNTYATNYCPVGRQVPGIFCGRGPTSQPCPTGTYCEISPVDAYAVCCPNYCPVGQQVPGIFCGRGPTSQPCPTGTYCEISPVDAYAVCCPILCTNGPPKYKGNKISKGVVTCDNNEQRCGSKYVCETIPNYEEKVCCPR